MKKIFLIFITIILIALLVRGIYVHNQSKNIYYTLLINYDFKDEKYTIDKKTLERYEKVIIQEGCKIRQSGSPTIEVTCTKKEFEKIMQSGYFTYTPQI